MVRTAAAEVGGGDEGAEEGPAVAGAGPVVDVGGGGGVALVEAGDHVVDQIGAHAVVGEPLAALVGQDEGARPPTARLAPHRRLAGEGRGAIHGRRTRRHLVRWG